MFTSRRSFTFGGERVRLMPVPDLHLDTHNGQRRFNVSVHEDRVIIDVRRRYVGGDWEPYTEFVMSLASYRKLVHWLWEMDMELESHG